jgi:dTDP-4-dehydrorhamnose reductase
LSGSGCSVLVLGASGMLGFALHRVLNDKGVRVLGAVRGECAPRSKWCTGLDYLTGVDINDIPAAAAHIKRASPNVVINAIGLKKAVSADDQLAMLRVNSLASRVLDAVCKDVGARFVHFSTDGVFSGRRPPYSELSQPDASDFYGVSKYLGEPVSENALVIRCSLVGRSLNGIGTLIDWVLASHGEIRGYQNAIFNGLTVNEVSKIVADVILPNMSSFRGVLHLYAEPISKLDLIKLVIEVWSLLGVTVKADTSVSTNRTLTSIRSMEEFRYAVPTWRDLLREMRSFYVQVGSRGGET